MTVKIRSIAAFASTLAASVLSASAAGTVNAYLSAPFTQVASASGTANVLGTENTNGLTGTTSEPFDGTTATGLRSYSATGTVGGTYTAPAATNPVTDPGFSIITNGMFGGGNKGNYLGVPAGDTLTLTFTTPVAYFGLEWCAVDAGNSLTLFDQNNAAIGTFNAATFQQILPNTAGTQITAINGTKYNTTDYFGQPTGNSATNGSRQNTGEQYAFLNFIGSSGTTISKIVFTETGATFESDNHAVRATAPAALGSFVPLGVVPEPSTWAMIIAAGALMSLTIGRSRRRAQGVARHV